MFTCTTVPSEMNYGSVTRGFYFVVHGYGQFMMMMCRDQRAQSCLTADPDPNVKAEGPNMAGDGGMDVNLTTVHSTPYFLLRLAEPRE